MCKYSTSCSCLKLIGRNSLVAAISKNITGDYLRTKKTPHPHVVSPSYKCVTYSIIFTLSRSRLIPLVKILE